MHSGPLWPVQRVGMLRGLLGHLGVLCYRPRMGIVSVTLVKVTVQVLDAFAPILAGVQASEDTAIEATRLTVVFAEAPP